MVRRIAKVLRYVWAGPNTLLGLVLALVAFVFRGRVRIVMGVVEVYGPAISWLLHTVVPLRNGALALTIGHVVLAQDGRAMSKCRRHERVHVRQYERWGPLFIPAYALASLVAILRGRHPYYENAFEREAFGSTIPAQRR